MEAIQHELRNRQFTIERELKIGVDEGQNQWVQLAEKIDSILMIVFMIILTIPTAYIVYPVLFGHDTGGPKVIVH